MLKRASHLIRVGALTLASTAALFGGLLALGITPASATTATLSFTGQPGNSTVNASLGTITVTITAGGTNTDAIQLSVTNGGGTISGCTNPATASSGVATFSGCEITSAQKAATLTATDNTSGGTATSSSFNVLGGATRVVFTTAPVTASADVIFTNQPVVTVEDSAGNTVTSDTSTITIELSPAASMFCTASSVTVSSGIATFSGCSTTVAGTFTLIASDPGDGLTGASAPFTVFAGSPIQLVFTIQPSTTSVASTITPAPTVAVDDLWTNPVTTDLNPITLTLGSNTTGATLSCAGNQIPTSGIATFSSCSVNVPGSYTLVATDSVDGLSTTSAAFTISSTATTIAAKSSSAAALPVGTSITYSATVAGSAGAPAPNGTVTFSNGSTPITGCTNLALSSSAATCTTSFTAAGTYTINVAYGATTTSLASSTSFTQAVVKPTPTVAIKTTSASHTKASFRLTFSGSQGAVSGTVVVRYGSKLISSVKLKSGVATFTTSKIPAGKRTLALRYAGSTVYAVTSLTESVKLR